MGPKGPYFPVLPDTVWRVDKGDNKMDQWQEIKWRDVADSCKYCKVTVRSSLTNQRTSHLLVPSSRVIEGLRNGGLKVYSQGREEILNVEEQSLERAI